MTKEERTKKIDRLVLLAERIVWLNGLALKLGGLDMLALKNMLDEYQVEHDSLRKEIKDSAFLDDVAKMMTEFEDYNSR